MRIGSYLLGDPHIYNKKAPDYSEAFSSLERPVRFERTANCLEG